MKNYEWEKAKSGRSRCHKCETRIDQGRKRLKVPAKFGTRDGYMFFCEPCASIKYDISSIRPLRENPDSVMKVVEGGEGRFYKHFRKITLREE